MPPLVILTELGRITLDAKTVNGARDIVRDLFTEAGVLDGWRMKPVQQVRGGAHLVAKLTPRTDYPLLITAQPGGNDTAWEWQLTPTISRKNFDNVQSAIRQALERRKLAQSVAPSAADNTVVEIKNSQPPVQLPPVDAFAEKHAKATQLVSQRELLRNTLRRIEEEQLTLLERQQLLEQQAKDAQAALDNDTAGTAAEAFLESYKVLLQSSF